MKDFGQWFKSLGQVPEVPVKVMGSDDWITYTATPTSACPVGLEDKMVEVKVQKGTAFVGGFARLGQHWSWSLHRWDAWGDITHYREAK